MDVSRSKDCKVMVHQTLKMMPSSRSQTRATCVWFDSSLKAEFFSNLKLGQLITLQSFDLQRPTQYLFERI